MNKEIIKKLALCDTLENYFSKDNSFCWALSIAQERLLENEIENNRLSEKEYKDWQETLRRRHRFHKKEEPIYRIQRLEERLIHFIDNLEEVDDSGLSEIERIIELKPAESKDQWEVCLNGKWYKKHYTPDLEEIENIKEDIKNNGLREKEKIDPLNSDTTGYTYIITVFSRYNDLEIFAVKTKKSI